MYASHMEEIKLRLQVVSAITSGTLIVANREDLSAELACLHLRKALELLAFASLVANKNKYAAAIKPRYQRRVLSNWEINK